MQSFFTMPDDDFLNCLESVLSSEAFKRIELWQHAADNSEALLTEIEDLKVRVEELTADTPDIEDLISTVIRLDSVNLARLATAIAELQEDLP